MPQGLGHYAAATPAEAASASIYGDTLRWYHSSDEAERGFCSVCGSSLFWRRVGGRRLSVFAGTIDGPTGLELEKQLYLADAGDYYDPPDVPAIEQSELG